MIKIKKILCPVDFFPGSDHAVTYATGFAAVDANDEQLPAAERILRVQFHVVGYVCDLLAVGRPRRPESVMRQSPDRLAGAPHDEDAAAVATRPKRDLLAAR